MTALLKICVLFLVVGLSCAQRNTLRVLPNRSDNNRGGPPTTSTEHPRILHDEDDGTTDQCPEPNGYFADGEQCDKYHACRDGKIEEKLCPDGMVFNDFSPDQEKCDLPYNIDCSKRSNLQTPIPSTHCPRQNGYFAHSDKSNCDTFYYCVDGKFNMIQCPSGLVFNPKTGICTWPDEAHKKGCSSEDVFDFTCPKVNETYAQTHPRYSDPDDCQYFYVCINGDVPRRNGCKLGQVFDEDTKRCEWARKVPDCADWYKDRLSDAELEALENPKVSKTKNRTKGPSRRKPAKSARRDEDEDEE